MKEGSSKIFQNAKSKKPLEPRNKNLALNSVNNNNANPLENKSKNIKKKNSLEKENTKKSGKENKSTLIIKKENNQLKNKCASIIQKFFRIYQKEKALKKLQEAKLKLAGSIAKLDSINGKQNKKEIKYVNENKNENENFKIPSKIQNQTKENSKQGNAEKQDNKIKKNFKNFKNLDISDILVKGTNENLFEQAPNIESVHESKIKNEIKEANDIKIQEDDKQSKNIADTSIGAIAEILNPYNSLLSTSKEANLQNENKMTSIPENNNNNNNKEKDLNKEKESDLANKIIQHDNENIKIESSKSEIEGKVPDNDKNKGNDPELLNNSSSKKSELKDVSQNVQENKALHELENKEDLKMCEDKLIKEEVLPEGSNPENVHDEGSPNMKSKELLDTNKDENNDCKNEKMNSDSSQKYSKLINYLQSIEQETFKECSDTNLIEESKITELQSREEITENRNMINSLGIELKEANLTIEQLKQVLCEERKKNETLSLISNSRTDVKYEEIKQEYEKKIEKNLNFIDQLVKEKTELADKFEKYRQKSKDQEKKEEAAIKELIIKHNSELKKTKEAWIAAEKLRKEKWVKEETDKIKELTIKSIEPEFQRLLTNHKNEMKELKDRSEIEKKSLRSQIESEFDEKIKTLKDKLVREREDTIEKEKEIYDKKLMQQKQRLEKLYDEQLKRQKESFNVEIERFESQIKRETILKNEELENVKKQCDEKIKQQCLIFETQIKGINDIHKTEIENLKSSLEKQYESNICDLLKRKGKEDEEKLEAFKDTLVKNRNKEIEAIINKMADEAIQTKKAMSKEYEGKLHSVEDKAKRDIESSIKMVENWEKENENIKSKYRELEENLSVMIRKAESSNAEKIEKDNQIENLTNKLQDLQKKFNSLDTDYYNKHLEIEHNTKLMKEESKSKINELENKISSVQKLHEKEKAEIINKNMKEIELVEKRIEQIVLKKDDIIKGLKEDIQIKNSQIDKYKELMDRQRKELIKK